MTDLPNEIFKKYGALAILSSFVAAIIIWGVAHWAASPGNEFSILWGLVKYTKASHRTQEASATEKLTETAPFSRRQVRDTNTFPAITLHVQNGVTTNAYYKDITNLRKDRCLRELSALESGKKVSDLPLGAYFFIAAVCIKSSNYKSVQSIVLEADAERYRANKRYAEFHNTVADGLQVLSFVSEGDAALISHLSGQQAHNIVISPYPWGQMTSLVSLPVGRIQEACYRYIQSAPDEEYTVLDVTIK